MSKPLIAALFALAAGAARAQEVAIGISGWTGFARLMLAKEAGLFKKHGLDVDRAVALAHPRHCAVKTTPAFVALKAELTEAVRAEVLAAQVQQPA